MSTEKYPIEIAVPLARAYDEDVPMSVTLTCDDSISEQVGRLIQRMGEVDELPDREQCIREKQALLEDVKALRASLEKQENKA